jgi:processing peptidase subunit alpha
MLRKGTQRILSAGLHTSAIAEQLPAVAVAPKKGLFSNLFGGSSNRVTTPLSDPLPGVVIPEHIAPPKDAPKTEMTTLSNGLKVASENTSVSNETRVMLPLQFIGYMGCSIKNRHSFQRIL